MAAVAKRQKTNGGGEKRQRGGAGRHVNKQTQHTITKVSYLHVDLPVHAHARRASLALAKTCLNRKPASVFEGR